jgi:hypothetical protein
MSMIDCSKYGQHRSACDLHRGARSRQDSGVYRKDLDGARATIAKLAELASTKQVTQQLQDEGVAQFMARSTR